MASNELTTSGARDIDRDALGGGRNIAGPSRSSLFVRDFEDQARRDLAAVRRTLRDVPRRQNARGAIAAREARHQQQYEEATNTEAARHTCSFIFPAAHLLPAQNRRTCCKTCTLSARASTASHELGRRAAERRSAILRASLFESAAHPAKAMSLVQTTGTALSVIFPQQSEIRVDTAVRAPPCDPERSGITLELA
jgi:hypothetical protein